MNMMQRAMIGPCAIAGLLGLGALNTGCQDAQAQPHRPGEQASSLASEVEPSRQESTSLATGLVGVAYGQEVQLHVASVIPPEPVHPPEPVIPPEPVQVLLSLLGQDGTPLAERVVELTPGRSATLRLPGPRSARTRSLVRAEITVVGANPPDDNVVGAPSRPASRSAGSLLATLELVDTATLRSEGIVTPLTIKGFNPQPEPPALPTTPASAARRH